MKFKEKLIFSQKKKYISNSAKCEKFVKIIFQYDYNKTKKKT